jgi:uncharacterized protein YjdB
MFSGRRLPITLAFVLLLGLAFGVSCKGFFTNPTLTSISINPTAPQVDAGKTLQLQAFGTYDDGSRKPITSGVSWSSSDPSVATVDPNTGILTGVATGTSTITASAQALSGTASATVLLTNVTAINVNPGSGEVHDGSGTPADFDFTATANGVSGIPLTTDNGGILTITPSASVPPTCTVNGNAEECSAPTGGTAGTYNVTMTYPGTSASATATLKVDNP